jgi:sialic acid synthase SpsE
MIILDAGSGTTCKNDYAYVRKMIDAIPKSGERIVIKWQLFENIPPLPPLEHDVYLYARDIAERRGFKTGSSVFDEESLDFLLGTDPAFVKIACRPHLYHLIDKVPESVGLVVSVPDIRTYYEIAGKYPRAHVLCCVADYPADEIMYRQTFGGLMHYGLSDHTENWNLYKRYKPLVYECHFRLEDSTGLDAKPFARTPAQLSEVL